MLAVACTCGSARAAGEDADQAAVMELAERYSPILALEAQTERCGAGEAYRPVPVTVVLGRAGVVLRGPHGEVVRRAPTAADLFGLGAGYYLDLPGDPLHPGCGYETQFREWAAGVAPLTYAHIARDADHPGRLALQFWFYYTFNDFTDKHESDWEMSQLDFDASTPQQALAAGPYELDLAQHGGGESASWVSAKVQKDGSHPIVYVATGSHADYFSSALYLGRSASEGFGCDNTSGADARVPLRTEVLPEVPSSASSPFAWLAFGGRWGQLEKGVNNGPAGPAGKEQWAHPIAWAQSLRSSSLVVPASTVLGTSVTSFFCGAVKRGAVIFNWALVRPWLFLAAVAAALSAGAFSARRTAWRPPDPLPLRAPRRGGQILRASARVYRANARSFIVIGAIFVPISGLAALLQWLLFHFTELHTFVTLDGRQGPGSAFMALLIGSVGAAIAAVIATAAVAVMLREQERGHAIGPLAAFALALEQLRALSGAGARQLVAVTLLTATIVGIPVAVWLFVRWSLFAEVCVFESTSARGSLRRSVALVRGRWWRTLGFTTIVDVVAALSGPLLGVIALLLAGGALAFINLVGSLIYALTVPYASIAFTLYYLDLSGRPPAPAAGERADHPR